jgi:2-keto-4-pentenoate hydratase/2-oxohepta-3-ene-1,7-dioic acid hydratase in catechol pathway
MIPMAQRYVRVKNFQDQVFYGLLQIDRSVIILDAAPWHQGQPTDQRLDPTQYELLAPCTPSKIVAAGINYRQHAIEMQIPLPKEPLIFLKPPSAIIADQQDIVYPHQSQQVDYEGELAVVMGAQTRNCSLDEAHSKIWGYTIANDVTARDLQFSDAQWMRAKGFDSFCPLGPWMVRELNPSAVLQTFLNDQLKQRQPVADMVFPPHVLVSYISQNMTLFPGDIILTGTPNGTGPMQRGDRVRVAIEGIGVLENRVI